MNYSGILSSTVFPMARPLSWREWAARRLPTVSGGMSSSVRRSLTPLFRRSSFIAPGPSLLQRRAVRRTQSSRFMKKAASSFELRGAGGLWRTRSSPQHFQPQLDSLRRMKLREMELLVRIAETGSMTLAARQLHLTPAAVSAAVRRIEDDLGLRIFERTTRTLHPTEEGLVVIACCEDVLDRWQRTLDEAKGPRVGLAGTVHLSAPTDTTYQVLESLVVALCTEHPALRVVLSTSDMVQHLHRDAIDLATRYGALHDSTLSARTLAVSPRVLVASPAYLDQWGIPDTPQSLLGHRCLTLHLANVPAVSWQMHRGDESHTVHIESPLCGDGFLARRWAVAGMGIAFKSLFDVIDELESGSLVRVLPDYAGDTLGIHAVFPSRRFQPTRVRTVAAAIADRCAARAARCQAWLAR